MTTTVTNHVHEACDLRRKQSLQARPRVHIQSPPFQKQCHPTPPPGRESERGVGPSSSTINQRYRLQQQPQRLPQAYHQTTGLRDNLRVRGRRRRGRVSSQKRLARNLGEVQWGHCHLENKGRSMLPSTSTLPQQPQPGTQVPHQPRVGPAPCLCGHSSGHPSPSPQALRLTPRPGLHQAESTLPTTLGQSCLPCEAKSSFHKNRPHPQAG